MDRMLTVPLAAVASLLFAACPATDEADAPVARDEAPAADATPGEPMCLTGDPFVAGGSVPVRDAEPGDGAGIAALRWQAYEGCERLVVDLAAADGSPARLAGRVTAEVLRDLGVVRVSLLDVETVDPDATDRTFDGALARSAYAMWAVDGRWVDVDVHLAAAAEAHVSTLDEPARVVVDLRPGGRAVPEAAPRDERVVVLEPRHGTASYPLRVAGYARTFEANVVVRLERNGGSVFEDFTTATAWVDAWGHYSLTIPEGPGGPVVLHVGEYSARHGSWQGVAVELRMR
jgi:hypothetical protein